VGAGDHDIIDLSTPFSASSRLWLPADDPVIKGIVSRMPVVLRFNRSFPGPAIDANGILGELSIPLGDLPPRPRDQRPHPISHFIRFLDHRVNERIAEWQRDVRVSMSDRLARTNTADGAPGDPTSFDPAALASPRLWRFEEVRSQPLHGNVHLVPHTELSGRLTRVKEARCLRMARHGMRIVSDMLCNTTDGSSESSPHGWEFMSPDDANIATGISQQDYETLRAAIPVEWERVIERGREDLWVEGDILTNPRGQLVVRVVTPPTRLLPGTVEQLQWQGATSRLVPTGLCYQMPHGNSVLTLRIPTRPTELPVSTEEEYEMLTAPENAAHPRAIGLAEAQHLSVQAVAIRGQGAAEDTQRLGYVRPCTVRMPRLMALGSAKTGKLYNLKSAQVWKPMRTIDATLARPHYYRWIQPHPAALQQKIVARWVDLTSASWLPGNALDLYRRRLHSGFLMGPEKLRHGWQYCLRCACAHGLDRCGPHQHEDVLHACQTCPSPGGAHEIMATVYRCWHRATGEELAATGATALFGDRRAGCSEEQEKQFRPLEQPWRVLHAAIVVALDKARRRTRPSDHNDMRTPMAGRQPRPWSAAKIIGLARREMDRILGGLAADAKRLGRYSDFFRTWYIPGLAVRRAGKPHATVLDDWETHVAIPAHTLTIATDGSGRRDGRAGYGVTARWLAPDEDPALPIAPPSPGGGPCRQPTLIEHYGPVDTDPASHMWIGATVATNNTGELTGIYVALQTAQAHAEPGDAVRILPDSMIALCTTTGAWKPKKNKALAGRNAKLLAALKARGIAVHFTHVRAHRQHHMNERADRLADLGAQVTTHFRGGRPLRRNESYQYTSSLPRPSTDPVLPPDTVPD
tara:strand:- start:229 stop:2817 length:2589 start_codon:yes stop_codon:yes gene_type:complete